MKFIFKQIKDLNKQGIKILPKKFFILVKFLSKLPMYFVCLPILFFIYLISHFYIVRFKSLGVNFGLLTIIPELYCCEMEQKINIPQKPFKDIYYAKRVINDQIYKMWKRTLIVGPSFFLEPIDEINKLISHFFTFAKKHEIKISDRGGRDILGWTAKIKKPHISFIEDEKKEAKKILSKFGLGEDDKFICLNVRDSAYHDKYFKDKNWDYQNFRNVDVNNYLAASEFLADQGYFVFRMGKAVNLPFKSKNSRIIDYANSKYRSDLLDIYLGANCEFCISSAVGSDAVPVVFRKPIVLIPHTLGYLNTYFFNSLAIPRPYFYSKEKRYLSMQEIFDMGIGFSLHASDFKHKGIVVEENTKEQIQEITEEMVQRLNGKWEDTELDKQYQNYFLKKFKYNLKTEKQKKLHGEFYIKIGSRFLKNNLNWLYN